MDFRDQYFTVRPEADIATPLADAAAIPNNTEVTVGRDESLLMEIDTNQTADLEQLFTITANTGLDTDVVVTAIHGSPQSGVSSSYTARDYSNTELATFTVPSQQTLGSVLNRLEQVVDNSTESPIDFTASVVSNRLILDASSVGSLNPGERSTAQWQITVNHNGGDGNIAVTGIAQTRRGRDTLSNINANVPESGGITFDNFHGATLGDN